MNLCFPSPLSRLLSIGLACTTALQADIVTFDSPSNGDNDSTRQTWLNEIQNSDSQYFVDFEVGFQSGDNVNAIGLAGELKMTSSDGDLLIADDGSTLGGSLPEGGFAVSHDENSTLLFDFGNEPVSYFALLEIDTIGAKYTVTLDDGAEFIHDGDTTAGSGSSAEFVGFTSDDERKITQISVTSGVGDGAWGIDSLEFGNALILYVDHQATGTSSGENWQNAFPSLQAALAAAVPPTSILIAEGIYRPDEGPGQIDNAPESAFNLVAGISIYGGFPSGGAPFDERSSEANLVFLSGLLGPNANAYHVLRVENPSESGSFRLEDIIVTGGVASGAFPDSLGGGMIVRATAPVRVRCVLERCTFLNNQSDGSGAGIFWASQGSPQFIDCLFRQNQASLSGGGGGGAARFSGGSFTDSQFVRCLFEGNSASRGGAIENNEFRLACLDCVFAGNLSKARGSAISIANGSRVAITNCTLQGNRVDTATANTIAGTIFIDSTLSSNALTGVNCLIWNNASQSVTDRADSSIQVLTGNFRFDNSIVENWNAADLGGTGNFDGTDPANAPRFYEPTSPLLAPSLAGELFLIEGSPAIDTGDTFAGLSQLDVTGGPRALDGDGNGTALVDIGAYEYTFGTYRGTAEIISFKYQGLQSPGNLKLFEMIVQGTAGQTFEVQVEYVAPPFNFTSRVGDIQTFTGSTQTLDLVLPPSFDKAFLRLALVEEE